MSFEEKHEKRMKEIDEYYISSKEREKERYLQEKEFYEKFDEWCSKRFKKNCLFRYNSQNFLKLDKEFYLYCGKYYYEKRTKEDLISYYDFKAGMTTSHRSILTDKEAELIQDKNIISIDRTNYYIIRTENKIRFVGIDFAPYIRDMEYMKKKEIDFYISIEEIEVPPK